MGDEILVTYATRHGSTEGVAHAIAEAFSEEDAAVSVKPVHEVEDLGAWRAVVLGSPLYAGKLLGDAVAFANGHREELSRMPVALFVVGLTMCRPSEKNVRKVVKQTKSFVELLRPTDVGLFAGALDYDSLGFFQRMMMKFVKIPEGDFRKWEVIRRWAKELLPKLVKEAD